VAGSHKAFDDTKVIINDLGQRSQTVGRARSIAIKLRYNATTYHIENLPNDLLRGIVFCMIDTIDEHGGIRRGSSDKDTLSATSQMQLGLFSRGESTSGLNDIIRASFTPFNFFGLHPKQIK
jgi:hypothetical protein